MIAKYGRTFDDSYSPAMVELWGYANDRRPEAGGLGAQRHLRRAMELLWPAVYGGEAEPGVPRWRDDLELLTWAWCTHRVVSVIGHASAAKTHTFAHIAAASYLADSPNSIVTLTSTHLSGLRKRLWADTVAAVQSAQLAPGKLGRDHFDVRPSDLTIRPRGSREEKYVIEGIATDRGQDAVEKIQGTHSRRRRYVIIDEAQGTPEAIFAAAANLMTDPDFRLAQLANPTRRYSEFGSWCEPAAGWSGIDPELDTHWATRRGGICVRLDGLRSANLRAGRTVFSFLIRQDYLESVRRSYGEGSARWWTYVRGWFAPEGESGVVCPPSVLARAEPPVTYDFPPTPVAALDPAFEGGDHCVLSFAAYGQARGSRWALQLAAQVRVQAAVSATSEPLDYLIAREVMRLCRARGVRPEDFIMDVTGAGRGVAAILQKEWGPIERCNFGGAPSDRRVKHAETEVAHELFDRFVSELWWAARAWMEEHLVGGLAAVPRELREQLAARQYELVQDKKISVEPKREMKARLGTSPDEADSFVLLIELLRRRGATAGSAAPGPAAPTAPERRLLQRAIAYSQLASPDTEYRHGEE